MPQLPKVCIIGAGCSGFTTAKRLKDHGIPYDCFEASDDVGGNWYYKNPTGMSSCYESLHIDTSSTRLQFEDFPVPADWPHFPHHSLMHGYFRDYVEKFGLRETITFKTMVEKARRNADGTWDVTLDTGETRTYDALVVANGHHWDPRMPEYPGTFDGAIIHSHDYLNVFDPIDMRGKNVVVVGMGNSALDIASELSHRSIAKHVWVSARRGVWVLTKYREGKPADKMMMPPWMPKKLGLAIARRKIKKSLGQMQDYGLPEPDHEPLGAHPSVSIDFLAKAGSGDLTCVPAIESLDGDHVRLVDGRRIPADVVVCATGYNMSFRSSTIPRCNRMRSTAFRCSSGSCSRCRQPVLHGPRAGVADDRQTSPSSRASWLPAYSPARTCRRRTTRCGASSGPTTRPASRSTTRRRGTRSRSTSRATCGT